LVLLAVVMASALERMRLYVSAFGLSATRLYATAFMVLLVGVFAWFAWTVLRGQRQRFVFGSLMQGLAVLAGLHLLNPDAFIVKTNLNRPAAERPFDAKYAVPLGATLILLYVIARVTKREPFARITLRLLLGGAGLYLLLFLGASLLSHNRVLAPGEEKHICEIDCHLAYAIAATKSEPLPN